MRHISVNITGIDDVTTSITIGVNLDDLIKPIVSDGSNSYLFVQDKSGVTRKYTTTDTLASLEALSPFLKILTVIKIDNTPVSSESQVLNRTKFIGEVKDLTPGSRIQYKTSENKIAIYCVTETVAQTTTVAVGTGASGYSGFSGYSGASGYSGISGYSGATGTGTSGFSGYSGYSGTNGASGISGFSGYSGFSGISGYSGATGASGISGYSGYSGISGYSGYSGQDGASGISGYSGYSGTNGASGISGYSGYSGYSGTSGFSGYSGFSGINGIFGGDSHKYQFSTTTTDTDPTTGYLAYNNATVASVTVVYVNKTNFDSVDISAWLNAIDDSTSSIKARIRIFAEFDSSIFADFNVNAATVVSGDYFKLQVAHVVSANTFSNNDAIVITFNRVGDSGISGYSGYSGISGYSGTSGYSGQDGASGISGYSGFSGYSGYSGINGTSGISGYSGYSGISGYSGYSGYSGISGYSGASGISGYSGTSGYSGVISHYWGKTTSAVYKYNQLY